MSHPSDVTAGGRPRDPEVDRKIGDAAVEVFGELGWAGFTVERVARRAGVGKASIYLRWPTKEALLVDALKLRVSVVSSIRGATVREEFVQLARQVLGQYLGDSGRAALRIGMEAGQIPGVAEHWSDIRESQVLSARSIVRRAIERGELPASTSVTLLLDSLCGAVMCHVLTTPAELRERLERNAENYVNELVDFLLSAVRG